jgi:uncharacterized protein YidB (DUF937 family)
MDDLLKTIAGGGQGQPGPAGPGAGPLGELLGNMMGGGPGSVLGGGTTAGAPPVPGLGGAAGNPMGGGLAALIPTLLPAILGLLGGQGGANQTGLHQLVDTMHANGLGNVAQSWVGSGPNQPISAAQIEQVLGSGQLSDLAAKSGLPPDQLRAGLAAILPHVVSGLTPSGSLPEPAQVEGMVGQLQQALGGLTGGQK